MTEHEGSQEGLPPLSDTGEGPTDEQRARQKQSPDPGHPASGGTKPTHGDPSNEEAATIGHEGQVKGQTSHPAPPDDVGAPAHEDLPDPAEGDKT